MTVISFTADRLELGAAIGRAAQGLPSRPELPVYAGMLFTVRPMTGVAGTIAGTIVAITAGDRDVTFTSAVNVTSDVTEEGSFILPGKMITDIFRYLPPGREVSVTWAPAPQGHVTIEAGRARYVFSAVDGAQYPVTAVDTKFLGAADGAEFADAVRFVVPAASRSDSRPTLRTVALSLTDGTLTMVATDSYRMAVVTPQEWLPSLYAGDEDPPQVLVPSWVMDRFARVAGEEAAIGWDGVRVVLGTQGLKVTAREIGGKYLDWQGVIARKEKADLHATADVPELTRMVKAAQLVAGTAGGIRLEFSADGHIHVRATGNGTCDEMTGTDYCGETVSFIIGPQMLLDGLAGCDEEAEFSFSANPLHPVFMQDGGAFRYFMQPRANIEEAGDQPA